MRSTEGPLMVLRLLTAAAMLVATASAASAADKLVQKVYHVADLVIPIPDFEMGDRPKSSCATPCPAAKEAKTCEADLIKLVQTTVAPQTWATMGGSGTIEYYPVGMALVANETPDV